MLLTCTRLRPFGALHGAHSTRMGLWLLLGGRGILLIDSRGPGFALSASKSFLWRSETSIQVIKVSARNAARVRTPGAVASAEVSDHITEYSLSESKTVKNRPILGSASQLGVGGLGDGYGAIPFYFVVRISICA